MSYYSYMRIKLLISSQGNIVPLTLIASAIIGFLTITGLYLNPLANSPAKTSMQIDPKNKTVSVGEVFTVQVLVESTIPVNVFSGLITFNESVLAIASIDYNTSIADLWAKEPWYSHGHGTITFAGGTTRSGGFTGNESLLSIKFTAISSGDGKISLANVKILQHDGLGTDAPLYESIDSILTVIPTSTNNETYKPKQSNRQTNVTVLTKSPNPDINQDGEVSISDLSVFMLYLTSNNPLADFNNDGKVNTADLSILLNSM